MKRAILFDLDGTLVDSRRDIANAANAALHAVEVPRHTDETISSFVGGGARRLIEKALGPSYQDRIEPAMTAFFAYYREHLTDTTRLYPGMEAMLDALPGPLAVLTNKPGALARALCEQLGMTRRFTHIWGPDDTPAHKPDPRGAALLCTALGAEAADARFVGDSRIDAQTAANARIPFVGVTWGFGSIQELREAGGERLVHDAGALRQALLEERC